MRIIAPCILAGIFAAHIPAPALKAQTVFADPPAIPVIRTFVAGGLGEQHPGAPPEPEQFGRLAGIWDAEQGLRRADGSWTSGPPGLWVWRYAMNGLDVERCRPDTGQ